MDFSPVLVPVLCPYLMRVLWRTRTRTTNQKKTWKIINYSHWEMDVLQFLWQNYVEYENGWTPIHMVAAKKHTKIISLIKKELCL